jgi:hypothetical protein
MTTTLQRVILQDGRQPGHRLIPLQQSEVPQERAMYLGVVRDSDRNTAARLPSV